MLKDLFPRAYSRYLALPILGTIMDDYVDWLCIRGYSWGTRRNHIKRSARIDQYFYKQGYRRLNQLTPEVLTSCWVWHRRQYPHAACAVHALHQFLGTQQYLPPPQPPIQYWFSPWLDRYVKYLQTVRGLASSTVHQHRQTINQFLEYGSQHHAVTQLTMLDPVVIEAFVTHIGQRLCRASLQHVVAHLRGFLRFLVLAGEISSALNQPIDTPRLYRQEQLPRSLPWQTVQALLNSIDRSTIKGQRDYAMFLLITTYGLRNCDILSLRLDDIDWNKEVLQICQAKTGQPLRLPLTHDVGIALLAYLQNRPNVPYRQIFLRLRAPIESLAPTAVTDAFQAWSARSGLTIPYHGSHCLRHSYAIHLLRQGVSLKAIGDLLGHRTFESTCVYLRFALEELREVALPVPQLENLS